MTTAGTSSLPIREYGLASSHLGPLLMAGGGIGVLSGGFLGDWAPGAGVGPLAVAITSDDLLAGSGIGLAIVAVASIGFLLMLTGFYVAQGNDREIA